MRRIDVVKEVGHSMILFWGPERSLKRYTAASFETIPKMP